MSKEPDSHFNELLEKLKSTSKEIKADTSKMYSDTKKIRPIISKVIKFKNTYDTDTKVSQEMVKSDIDRLTDDYVNTDIFADNLYRTANKLKK